MFKLDKTAFAKVTFEQADNRREYWLSKTPTERIQAAIYLQSIVFGFDPEIPPRMDKTFFTTRTREN